MLNPVLDDELNTLEFDQWLCAGGETEGNATGTRQGMDVTLTAI